MIIPSYNRAATLGRAMESVLHQTYAAFEIIVVDDGSTDQTRLVVKKYPTVSYCYQENQGVSAARNKGAKLATGDWLIFLDADDELLPDSLASFDRARQLNLNAKIIIGGFHKVFQGKHNEILPYSVDSFIPLSGTYCMDRQVFENLGGFDEYLKFSENTELFFRIRQQGISLVFLTQSTLKYYQSNDGGSKNLPNQLTSLRHLYEKHAVFLSSKERFTYKQLIGVLYCRVQNFHQARISLFQALALKPYRLDTGLRLLIASLPFISKKIYR